MIRRLSTTTRALARASRRVSRSAGSNPTVFASNPAPRAFEITSRCFSSLPEKSKNNLPAQTSKDGVVGFPIDFDIQSKVEGSESQIVTIDLEPDQVLRAESGAMMYMTENVTINTTTGGGLSEGFKRMLTGQNFFISDYTYEGAPGTTGTVALGTDFPSKILRLNVDEYGGKIV